MSFALGPGGAGIRQSFLTPSSDQSESIQDALARARDPLGALSISERLLLSNQPQFNLPALPKIPKLEAAPSRLNSRQIAAAARRQRVSAARRKGRASTILGGSIGAEPERKTLLGA